MFTKQATKIYTATKTLTIGRRAYRLEFRIDGREGAYRVDCAFPLFPMWEAIDGGTGFSSVAKAKAHVRSWCAAAVAQEDLHPRMG